MRALAAHALRLLGLLLVCALALQLAFLLQVAALRWVDPWSTAFQRSEAWRLVTKGPINGRTWTWRHQWVPAREIAPALARAVIASEDAGFTRHRGVDWQALQQARARNERARSQAERLARQRAAEVPVRLVGGSTITQQLAKNLWLSGERTAARKLQEAALALALDALLPKARVLEIYLNHVEWGEGVWGAQAAAQRHFGIDAARLSTLQAARLAVMLPAPKRFERRPDSPYIRQRSATVAARMGAVDVP
jgi:monofunctional biosynthetic peptidoglycan transglycosylase